MRPRIDPTPEIMDYVVRNGVREHPVLAKCRDETAKLGPVSAMQIGPEQGALLALLVQLIGARRTLEVGIFTGYSALSIALALPADGRITAFDISEDYVTKAKAYWREAGVDGKIDARLGPAARTFAAHVSELNGARPYDFCFIDADKTGYDSYYELALEALRPGGLIALDNVLWSGRVIDARDKSADTEAIRALNAKISKDERVDICLLPMADGLFLCRKR